MLELIGFTGAALLAVCAIPQTIKSIVDGHARGISHLFLLSWYVGEILMLIFCHLTIGAGPLFYNYLINTLLLTIIVKYKYKERK